MFETIDIGSSHQFDCREYNLICNFVICNCVINTYNLCVYVFIDVFKNVFFHTFQTQYKFIHQVLLNFLKRGLYESSDSVKIDNEDDDDANGVTFDPIGSSFI